MLVFPSLLQEYYLILNFEFNLGIVFNIYCKNIKHILTHSIDFFKSNLKSFYYMTLTDSKSVTKTKLGNNFQASWVNV